MKPVETIKIQYYQSFCGELILGSYQEKLCLCDWMVEERRGTIDKRVQNLLHVPYEVAVSDVTAKAIAQLDDFFARRRTTFDIPLLFPGTDFQKMVWNELLNIPYGTTISYIKLSERLGNVKAVRAVAAANGANPISIFVPCHRVIGSNGKLIGYGGGLAAKKRLLELESNCIDWG